MDFELKFEFFKICKISYTRPLCIINMEYGPNSLEIWSFDQFLSHTGDFR
jgi:hypothetical protein